MQSMYKMILFGGIRDVVQLVDCLLTVPKDPSSNPYTQWEWWCTPAMSALGHGGRRIRSSRSF